MNGNRIVSTSHEEVNALVFQGMRITDQYHQIVSMIRSRFTDEHALLFAEPVFNRTDGSVDWYTPIEGRILHLSELPRDEQNSVREKIMHMAGELEAFAEELKTASPEVRTSGNVLELALSYPDESCLYVVNGHAVCTCWGFEAPMSREAPRKLPALGLLAARESVRPPEPELNVPEEDPQEPSSAPPAREPPTRRRSAGFLWWLLPLLLLLLLLWVLFTSFGKWPALGGTALFHAPALPFGESTDPADTARKIRALHEDNQALKEELAALLSRLKEHVARCRPDSRTPAAEKTVPPERTPPAEKEKQPEKVPPFENRHPLLTPIREFPARSGAVDNGNTVAEEKGMKTPMKTAPAPEAPGRGGAPVPSGERAPEMVIPTEKDLGFLEGRWRCETGLYNSETGEPLTVEFEFGSNGRGMGYVHEKTTGDRCTGEAHARQSPGRLSIELKKQMCDSGLRKYSGQNIDCVNSNGVAQCQGRNEGGRPWQARFYRIGN